MNFINRGNWFLISLQNILISSAPMFVGAGVVFICQHFIRNVSGVPLWGKIVLGYLGVSMFFHMTMSPQDVKVYGKGVPVFIGILFVLMLVLRLMEIV